VTNDRKDGERSELASSSTMATSTNEPTAADDSISEDDVEDRAAARTTASTEPSAVASERLEGPPISVQDVPGGMVSSLDGSTIENVSDVGGRAQPRQDKDDVQVVENDEERVANELMSLLSHVLKSRAADADYVIDDALLEGGDNRDYHGVRNVDENSPGNTGSTPWTLAPALDYTADTKFSIVERDEVPSLEMPADDQRENKDGYMNVVKEVSKLQSWQGGHNDASATSLRAVDRDAASKFFKEIVNNSADVFETNSHNITTDVRTLVDLLQSDTNRMKSTADSNDLTVTREALEQMASPELAQRESTIKESWTTFPHPENENALSLESPSQDEQITVESSDRQHYNKWKAATTTVKPKPDVVTGNGNCIPIRCSGRLVCTALIEVLLLILNSSQLEDRIYTVVRKL